MSEAASLAHLARLYGVQTTYYGADHRRTQSSPAAVHAVLRALGAPLETLRDVPTAVRERHRMLAERCVEPVIVAWDGGPAEVTLCLPERMAADHLACRLRLEDGAERSWSCDLETLRVQSTIEVEGQRYVNLALGLPGGLPAGYHRLALELEGRRWEALLIAAPSRAYSPPDGDSSWGVFLPLYALHSKDSWGCGDLSNLDSLSRWAGGLGASTIATLPLLAAFLDEPFEPSPYMPVSRLFWNELYVNIASVPEFQRCEAARAMVDSPDFQAELASLRAAPLVDYRRAMALKRHVLEELARCFYDGAGERQPDFQRFLKDSPLAGEYARFRAAGERLRHPWPQWPQRMRDGVLQPGDYPEEAARYHLYVQFLAHQQLEGLAVRARSAGQRLYLDLPLGVHPHGFDVWRERGLFTKYVSAGAPPDAFLSLGQDWAFPPVHPERAREQGYRYLIAYLRHHMQRAGMVRVDHVMGLHRLYWVPRGMSAADGAYVHYPAEELYAVLCLESQRAQCAVAGEDLGVAPAYVRRTMAQHNISRLYTLQFQIDLDARRAVGAVSSGSVASLNTHDMPAFAAFWRGLDIHDRQQMSLLNESQARQEMRERQAMRRALVGFLKGRGLLDATSRSAAAVLKACLAYLASSRARAVLVNLEDLWLETRPQNVPGTGQERPNWRRKARHSLEVFSQMPRVVETLRAVGRLRKPR
ncbi:MAG: 4-alpha-glucanotransferase [Chloroflexota bacterium]|nr:4-alpha-glucanotransferase [Chloroflexota bacterium]